MDNMCIRSILDTDLYKFSTSFAYMKLFPDAEGEFEFNDRDRTCYSSGFLTALEAEFENLGRLELTKEEFLFVNRDIPFIPECYWEWLRGFRFSPEKIKAWLDEEERLHITVMDKMYKVTLYETPILAIVSELRNRMLGYTPDMESVMERLAAKVEMSNAEGLRFSEFGMRRRFSYDIQDRVCAYLKENARLCTGTSNVHMAMRYGMKVMGTHPHEWFMFHGAEFGYKQANYLALENWVNVYDGDLGIALSDTYTSEVFFKNFSCKQAKLFDGVRQDSGDPYLFTDKLIERYRQLGIDPASKTIVFSNALDFPAYKGISDYCKGKIRCSAGIGTNLTNDTGFKPSNIVMKLMKCRMNRNQPWFNCIKISDDHGKHMGSQKEIEICMHECGIN